ncbi:hypothetical protein K491DRAFT_755195 [Lophiostoma macrostomum CBS 122681]|uniref:Uncharacterized protein n=1 Tax=Lophiostoma macrostomum CBS 122681 TaxID=1314788 RepID=A0A6A6TL29_9PLEO|nr:hypothetical protein K491DRAFT_755195 [Lophiostoma macrostomum CBS 122681]
MKSAVPRILLGTSVLGVLCGALPAALEKRRPGDSPATAVKITVDCTGQEDVCNADCFAILCYNIPNSAQWNKGNNAGNRKESGAARQPFKMSTEQREARGVHVLQSVLNAHGASAEETLMANTIQGGAGDLLVAVDAKENIALGGKIGSQLQHNLQPEDWYYRWFTNYGAMAPYCDALQSTPPDTSICKNQKKKPDDDVMNRAMVRTDEGTGSNPQRYNFHMYQEGDKWPGAGHFWPGGSSKREEPQKVENRESDSGAR